MEAELSDISSSEIEAFYKRVSDNIKKARMKANVSQLDLALKLGIKSIAFYSNCENLKYNKHFNLEQLYKISKALNIDMCEIIGDL
ncbi:MAG: XRE family transcriptional regulator [Sulfurovum sp. FS08-3]|nr:MAG: XRE family transcriptional regulator [Sulfurovum sp. FS08-3]